MTMDKKALSKIALRNGLHSSDVAAGWLEKYVARYQDRFLVVGVESDRDCDPPWEMGDFLAAPLNPRRDRTILADLRKKEEDDCEVYFGQGGVVYAAAGEGWFALPSESAISFSGLPQGTACEKAKVLASQGASAAAAFEEFGCLAWFAMPAVAQDRLLWLGGWVDCCGGYQVASPSALAAALGYVKEAIAETLAPGAFSEAGEWDEDTEELFRDWEVIEIK